MEHDYSDERALALVDQIIAAYEDDSKESAQTFDSLTTEAVLHLSNEQYRQMQQTLKERR